MRSRIILLSILILTSFTIGCTGGNKNEVTEKDEQQPTKCEICDSGEHLEDECLVSDNTDAKCTFCGKSGHIIAECPHLKD